MSKEEQSLYSFYKDKNILITGGTGFVGKVLLEKILRSLDCNKVYLIIRDSKQTAQEKYDKLLSSKAFLRLRDRHQGNFEDWFRSKVKLIKGDLTKDSLAMSKADRELLKSDLDILIHCGASVDFDANIYDNFVINVEGTLALYELSESCSKDIAFTYVSTAYVNSYKGSACISEYSSPKHFVDADSIVANIRSHKENAEVDFGGHPNTYTYTKSLAETILLQKSKSYKTRVSVLRPSCICASYKEPFPGWLDSISATSAVILFTAMGATKTLQGSAENIADNIPVDYVANGILVGLFDSRNDKFRVYHSSSSSQNPMTWGDVRTYTLGVLKVMPFQKSFIKPSMSFFNYDSIGRVHRSIKYKVPYRMFFLMSYFLPEKYSLKILKKLEKGDDISRRMYELFSFFVRHQWIFKSEAMERANSRLSEKEKLEFKTDLRDIDWSEYFLDFIKGIKVFVAEIKSKKKGKA